MMRDSFILNFLSAINVAVGFAFYLVIGRLWGLSKELDLFFSFYVLLNYTGYIAQIFWEGYAPFYAELKTKKGKREADKLFSVLLNRSSIVAVLLIMLAIVLYPVVNKLYFGGSLKSLVFYFVFLPFLVLQNFFFLIKSYLQLNFSFKASYILDISANLFSLITVLSLKGILGILALVIGVNLGFFIAGTMGILYAIDKLNFKYCFSFKHETIKEIFKGSFWLKAGGFAYGAKDIIINHLLLGLGEGVVSAYSYASKFISAVHLVVNAPIVMKFANEVMYEAEKLRRLKEVLKRVGIFYLNVIPLFCLVFMLVGFSLKVVLPFLFSKKNVPLLMIEKVYVILGGYILFVLLSYPVGYIMHSKRKFFTMFFANFLTVFSFMLSLLVFNLYKNIFLIAFANFLFAFYLFLYYILLSAKITE